MLATLGEISVDTLSESYERQVEFAQMCVGEGEERMFFQQCFQTDQAEVRSVAGGRERFHQWEFEADARAQASATNAAHVEKDKQRVIIATLHRELQEIYFQLVYWRNQSRGQLSTEASMVRDEH